MQDPKLLDLLDVLVDYYISKGDPIWSKFLYSLEDMQYAPSTLRKYLNVLEKAWLVYQPYNSSGRIPTVQGLRMYLEHYMADTVKSEEDKIEIEIKKARNNVEELVKMMWGIVDGVVVGFLRNDEYFFLGINNLLRDDLMDEYKTTRKIISFIEQKQLVKLLDGKILKRGQVYYTFIEDPEAVISCLYAKVVVGEYDCLLSIIWSARVDYKKNVTILQKIVDSIGS